MQAIKGVSGLGEYLSTRSKFWNRMCHVSIILKTRWRLCMHHYFIH